MRGHTFAPSKVSSRFISSSYSNKSEELYLDWIQKESDKMVQDEPAATSDSVQLEYAIPKVQYLNVSKVANTLSNMRTKHIYNVAPTCSNSTMDNSNDIINIQLNYDVNQALNQDLWDGEFRATSLHSSMEYIGSDIKNIKESLFRIEKYILGKGVEGNANAIKDLKGIGKVA